MALSSVIESFATGTYTITRKASGSYTNGVYAVGASSSLSITASVQPINGFDLKNAPEGQQADDLRVVFTNTLLKTRTSSSEPDLISISNLVYEIVHVEHWSAFGETFYRALAAKRAAP